MSPVVLAAATPGAGSVLATLFALAMVIGLVFALGWLLRRLPGGFGRGHDSLRVVASLGVGAKERVLVVEAGGRQLLIGVTAHQITLLDALPQPLPEVPPQESFAAVLARQQRAAGAPWMQTLARQLAATPAMRRFGERARGWAPIRRLVARSAQAGEAR